MKDYLFSTILITFLIFSSCQNATETDQGHKSFEVDPYTIALYHMNELTGSTTPEAVNRWPGVNSGAEIGIGIQGMALLFNSGNYAKLDTIIPHGQKAGTIEFYVKFGDAFNNKNSYSILGNDASRFQIIYTNDSLIYMKNHSNLFKFVKIPFAVDRTKWYHIAATWGSGGMRLFINDILSGSIQDTSNYQHGPDNVEQNVFYIGKKSSCCMEGIKLNTALSYSGYIDEIRFSSVERY